MIDGDYEPYVIGGNASLTLAFLPNQPSDDAVQLTLEPHGYDGNPLRIEVMGHKADPSDPEDSPCVWIQRVEGCGYDVQTLTPDEAEALAISVEKERQWTSPAGTGPSAHVPARTYRMTQVEAALVADLLRQAAVEANLPKGNGGEK